MKSQKIKSQKLHVPILETNRKNLHQQKKTVIRYAPVLSEMIQVLQL